MWRARGITLPEVLLAFCLLFLVAGLTYQLVAGFLRYGGALTVRGQLQQMAAVALSRVAADARRSTRSGVGLEPTVPVLSLAQLEGVDSTGQQVWSTGVVLYYLQSQRLLRRLARPPGLTPDRAQALKPTTLLGLSAEPGGLCLADSVRSFQVRWEGSSSALSVELSLLRASGPGREEEFQLRRDLSLRNSP